MSRLFYEAFVVGVATIIFGNLAAFVMSPLLFKVELPKVCGTWNKFYSMEITLFMTGFLLHLFSEFSGINRWYCNNGVACSRRV